MRSIRLSDSQVDSYMNDGNVGFCLHCGAMKVGVEPDAENYECDRCRRRKVYGLEQLLMLGLIEIRNGGKE